MGLYPHGENNAKYDFIVTISVFRVNLWRFGRKEIISGELKKKHGNFSQAEEKANEKVAMQGMRLYP
jgi:hypothetical protein